MTERATPCRVRVTRPLYGVYPEYQPVVGKIYAAMYAGGHYAASGNYFARTCIIEVAGKKICLRPGEYVILEEGGAHD